MFEHERKYLLTYTEYTLLCNAFNGTTHTHINYDYDTENYAYNHRGVTCRIRKKGDACTATIKAHGIFSADCNHETSAVARDEYDTTLFEGMHVVYQGCLQTERKEFFLPDGTCVALDKNTYLDQVDYELEIEYPSQPVPWSDDPLRPFAEVLTDLLPEKYFFSFCARRPNRQSKSARFFARKMKQQRR